MQSNGCLLPVELSPASSYDKLTGEGYRRRCHEPDGGAHANRAAAPFVAFNRRRVLQQCGTLSHSPLGGLAGAAGLRAAVARRTPPQ